MQDYTGRDIQGMQGNRGILGTRGGYRGLEGLHDEKGCAHRGMELDLSKLRKTEANWD